MFCGKHKEELTKHFGELERKARNKGYRKSAGEFQKARELIPKEGCVTPDEEREISFHYEQGHERLKERKEGNSSGWAALAGLISPFVIWGFSELIKATAKLSSFLVNCPACGKAIKWPAGLRSGNCPFCGIRLEWKGG